MNMNQNIQKLKEALKAISPLSFAEAQAQIPNLVIAELSGDDIEQEYAAVLQALDQYPELAEEYYLQMEEHSDFLKDSAPLPMPSTIPTFFPKPVQRINHHTSLSWGQLLQNFLISLNPPLLAKSLDDPPQAPDDDPDLNSIEYMNDVVSRDTYTVTIQATLQRINSKEWQLTVVISSVPTIDWKVSATLKNQALPILEHQAPITRFGPLPSIPDDTLSLAIEPDQAQ